MRNLKRALSLTLASVMLLGMMVVGAGAAGFPDVDENDNVEAIEVLNAVEVILGYDNGDFGPDDLVTRAQMAVIMAKLLDLDYQYYEAVCPFTDVPAWARGYVGACYAHPNKIVSGYSATTYGPDDGITPVQAASMMMRALGYFQYAEDYKAGFEVSTVRQGTEIGIFEGVGSSATAQMTRNQVAKMALNALQSEMVTFTGTPGIEVNGVTVGYRPEYTARTSTEAKYQAIEDRSSDVSGDSNHRGQYYIQLGEELYNGKLRLNSTTDAFERPARHWEYDGKAIGTYVKEELLRKEWTEEVTGKMLYDLLTKPTIDTYTFTIAVDGEVKEDNLKLAAASGAGAVNYFFDKGYLHNNYKSGVGGTGNGVLTQVFVDTATRHVYISVINTYLAKAAGDYSDVRETVTYNVYGVDNNVAAGGSSANPILVKRTAAKTDNSAWVQTITVSADDFDIADVKKDDIILVNVAKGTIQIMMEPEVMASATLTAFAKSDYVVSEGDTIKYNNAAEYDVEVLDRFTNSTNTTNLRDKHYNLYLDRNGFLAGIELVEADNNYIFLTGIDSGKSDLRNKTAEAAGILMDGTFVNIQMDMDKSRRADGTTVFQGGSMWNTWCTYSVNSSNVYTLREVGDDPTAAGSAKVAQFHDADYVTAGGATGKDINIKNYSLAGANVNGFNRVYGNEKSVYMTAKLTNIVAKENLDSTANNGGKVIKSLDSDTLDSEAVGLAVATGNRVAIISDVDVRTEGIANTDMTTWTYAETLAKATPTGGPAPMNKAAADGNNANLMPTGVYTLYDNKGYVVAAIVIGEDNGLTKSIYWVNSAGVKEERFEASSDAKATDGEWVWSREVVDLTDPSKGVTKIYERGSALEVIGNGLANGDGAGTGNMRQYGVYQVKFNGKGEVTGKTAADLVTGIYFTNDPSDIEDLIGRNKEIVVYSNRNADGTAQGASTYITANGESTFPITFSNGTLHVGTGVSEGFPVDTDVLTLLIQTNGGKKTTVDYHGTSGLTSALNLMHVESDGSNGTQKRYNISALIRGGRAITIVIEDAIIDGAVANPITPSNPTGTHPSGILVDTRVKTNLKYYNANKTVTNDEAAQDITKWLVAEGWTILTGAKYNGTSGAYEWVATKNGGSTTYDFAWTASDSANHAQDITIHVNGKPYAYDATQGTAGLLQLAGVETDAQSSYVKRVKANNDVVFGTAAAHGTTLADGDQLTTGYLAVVDNTGSGADVTSLVDVSNLECDVTSGVKAADSAQHYALPGTAIKKLSTENASASGISVGASTSMEYVPYTGGTYGMINQKDGTDTDWKAQINAIGKVKITFVDHTINPVPATTTYVTAQDVADLAEGDHSSLEVANGTAITTFGTHYYINNTSGTALANAATTGNALADGDTVHVGYVQTAAAVGTTLDGVSGIALAWSNDLSTTPVLPVGTTITATITFTAYDATGGKTIKASKGNGTYGYRATTPLTNNGAAVNASTAWAADTLTINTAENSLSGVVEITFNLGKTTAAATPTLALA